MIGNSSSKWLGLATHKKITSFKPFLQEEIIRRLPHTLFYFILKRGNLYTSSIHRLPLNNYKLNIKIHIINEVHVNKYQISNFELLSFFFFFFFSFFFWVGFRKLISKLPLNNYKLKTSFRNRSSSELNSVVLPNHKDFCY